MKFKLIIGLFVDLGGFLHEGSKTGGIILQHDNWQGLE